MQTKVTKPQLAALIELKRRGGAVISSEWTRGRGRYTSRRPVPPYCERITKTSCSWITSEAKKQTADFYQANGNAIWPTKVPQRIKQVFKRHPKCEAVIAITNMRAVNKTIQQAGGQS